MIKPETFLQLPPQEQMRYQKEFQSEYQKLYEDIQGIAIKQQKFVQQRNVVATSIHENEMVKKEFEALPEDGEVYKLIGPTLLKMDLEDAQDNVNKRLHLFNNQTKKLDKDIEVSQKEVLTRKKRMDLIDETFKNIKMMQIRRAQMQQRMQQQQAVQQQQEQQQKKKKGNEKRKN